MRSNILSATITSPRLKQYKGALPVAHYLRFDPPSPLPFSDTAVALPPRTRFNFELVGLKSGNTTVVMRDRTGKPLANLLVSVKAQVSKTYTLCRLSDMCRTCPWPVADLRPMMQLVERTFLQQANIRLTENGAVIHEVNINDRDLGDPLIPMRVVQPENMTINFVIVSRTPARAFLANFVIYFTWDLRAVRRDIVGHNFGQVRY